MNFLDKLTEHMETYVRLSRDKKLGYHVPYYVEYLKRLRDEQCKRIMFDARQAALFDELDESPPPNVQRRIHSPFPMFYMEFTEPILLAAQEPGQHDYARALMYVGPRLLQERLGGEKVVVEQAVLFLTADVQNTPARSPIFRPPPRYNNDIPFTDTQYVDRAWTLKLNEGLTLARVKDARETDSEVPADWNDEGYIIAGEPIPMFKEDRAIGWWEHTIVSYTALLSWICTYIMAKGIHVALEPVSRQVRRWHERKQQPLPKPWHIVKVEPKWSTGRPTGQNPGGQHRYRYDVIGHLRFGKHRRGDGTYNETIEWVPPHQRGLANEIYIPKLYKVEKGKVISPLMRRYYGQQ